MSRVVTSKSLLLILVLLIGVSLTSNSQSGSQILYVSSSDPDCGGRSPCYDHIQIAVDEAPEGAEVRIAAGLYSATFTAEVDEIPFTQVVLITKSLTLSGGYSESDWDSPDPVANETIIDPDGLGRGITIRGDGSQAVTISGFIIQGGDYSDLGNPEGVSSERCARTASDCGGGLFANRVQLILRDTIIRDNVAGTSSFTSDGGGAFLWLLEDDSMIDNVQFINNRIDIAGGSGGGLNITGGGSLTISNCHFESNFVSSNGGGLFIFQSGGTVTLEDSKFIANSTDGSSGAVEARVVRNGKALQINRVFFEGNSALGDGTALSVLKQGTAIVSVGFENLIFASNHDQRRRAELSPIYLNSGAIGGLELESKNITIADHNGLSAFRIVGRGDGSILLSLANTLISDAENAFIIEELGTSVTIYHESTFLENVEAVEIVQDGDPVINGTNEIQGNASLDDRFHLQADSEAIDAGIDSGLANDIDGDARPQGEGFDIGADEYVGE